MVPAVIPLLLMLIPAMLTALSVVREKELGSIVNLYVTPVTRLEFLLGKQLPYVALAMLNFLLLTAARGHRLRRAAEGQLSRPWPRRRCSTSVCATAIGLLDLHLHAQPDRRHLRHRDPDHRSRRRSSPA